MLRNKKIGFISLVVASFLSAGSVNVSQGWNLISTDGVDNVPANCILNQLDSGALIWTFENGQWYAKSNSQNLNGLIQSAGYSYINNVSRKQGFWILNPGSSTMLNINTDCNDSGAGNGDDNGTVGNGDDHGPNIIYGAESNITASQLLTSGNQYIEPEGDGYGFLTINNSGSIQGEWYRIENNSSTLEESFDINTTISSDYNISYSMTSGNWAGEQGYLIIDGVKEILQVDDLNVTNLGIKEISMTGVVTSPATNPIWEEADWQPKRWDEQTQQEVPITDVVTFKNEQINPNNVWWHGDEDGDKWAFADSNDTTITSGNIVKVEWDGTYYQNCGGNDCRRYQRTNQVIGSWSLSNDILSADTTYNHREWKFDNNKLYRIEYDKAGSTHQMKWLWSPNHTQDVLNLVISKASEH